MNALPEIETAEHVANGILAGLITRAIKPMTGEPPTKFFSGDVAAITDGERWALSISRLDHRGPAAWPADPKPGFLCRYGKVGDRVRLSGREQVVEITAIRLDRLHTITLGEICQIGLARSIYDFVPVTDGLRVFREYWSHQYGSASWEANPWVWSIGVKPV